MFKYVTNISELYHNIIKTYLKEKNVAIDATLGNGHDTDFLSEIFNKVYTFDIQELATNTYKEKAKNNVIVINDSHEYFKNYVKESVECIIYNLGYLPGENKHITTKANTTLKSICEGLDILAQNGLMFIGIYSGHEEGNVEKEEILKFVKTLPKNRYGVIYQQFLNRNNNPPSLIIIEKK
ncbi:tRNA (mnm(5)s(2)U34)-methyltransferase [Clostridium tarantellae]|uniref:rRNA methylase n=1 Tax=Clostridium tarantellae TaxID=39493 RepID=A0A6I1MLS9_9CLOT|nr:class I SAM-dependent methyltransferase [Clostridium tarantellae]MPQ44446.1 rRNA methylase [Clostridium tarantellae]